MRNHHCFLTLTTVCDSEADDKCGECKNEISDRKYFCYTCNFVYCLGCGRKHKKSSSHMTCYQVESTYDVNRLRAQELKDQDSPCLTLMMRCESGRVCWSDSDSW